MAELWDLYDRDRKPLGRTHPRGEPLPAGAYHLAVTVAVFDSRGEILLTRRSPQKEKHPGCWEIPGGCAQAGEGSLAAACRELREETGIQAAPEELTLLTQELHPTAHLDIYAVTKDAPAGGLHLQPGETDAAQWLPLEEWLGLAGKGEYLTPSWRQEEDNFLYRRLGQYRDGKRDFEINEINT